MSQNTLDLQPIDDIIAATKSFVDSLSENDCNRRDISTVFNDHDNEFATFI